MTSLSNSVKGVVGERSIPLTHRFLNNSVPFLQESGTSRFAIRIHPPFNMWCKPYTTEWSLEWFSPISRTVLLTRGCKRDSFYFTDWSSQHPYSTGVDKSRHTQAQFEFVVDGPSNYEPGKKI